MKHARIPARFFVRSPGAPNDPGASVLPALRSGVALAITGSAVLLVATALVAVFTGARTFGAYLALMAVLPFSRYERLQAWGRGLAYGAFGWELFGLAPALSGMRLEGPFGGSLWRTRGAFVITVLRVAALRAESAAR